MIIYGPLHSRRLGKSLGINLLPEKICSLDCVYCEAGVTKNLTIQREEYIPFPAIIEDLAAKIKENPDIDYITLCGIGEPTLYKCIGKLIQHIKATYPSYLLCLITNSTMIVDNELQDDLLLCDLIMPSLDAVSPEVFQKINRPHIDIDLSKMIEALIKFREKYPGQLWLEIFFLEGINDTLEELTLLKETCQKIKPDLVQLNSLDRNGLYDWVKKIPYNRLLEIQDFMKPLDTRIV